MKKFNYLICTLLCMFAIVGISPLTAQKIYAQSGSCGTGASWNYDEDMKVLTISGKGTITGLKSFPKETQIDTIIVKSGIEAIGEDALRGYHFSNIVLEEGLKKIGSGAFWECKGIKEIIIPKSVTEIGSGAFEEVNTLKKVTVLGNVKVGRLIFGYEHCVQTLEIAGKFEDLASIGACEWTLMPQIVLINNNPNYCIENHLVMSADKKILYSIDSSKTSIKGTLVIPDSVVEIKPYAFYEFDIDKVKLGKNLKIIGECAFSECFMKNKLVIPENVEIIGKEAFAENILTSVKFNKKIKTIGEAAFSGNEIKKVRFYNYPKMGLFAFEKAVIKEYYGEKKISHSVVKANVNQGKMRYQINVQNKSKKKAKYKITIKYGKKTITIVTSLSKKGKKKLSVKMKDRAVDQKHKIYVKVKRKGKWGKKVRIL